jgi:hypothetical protein
MGGNPLKSFCKKNGWVPLYNRNIFICQAFHSARKITSLAKKLNFKVGLGTISYNVSLWKCQCECLTLSNGRKVAIDKEVEVFRIQKVTNNSKKMRTEAVTN